MSLSIEIKYFNSFLLRKTIKGISSNAVWAGIPYNPEYYPTFPIEASTSSSNIDYDWFVEESKIKGKFNGAEVDLGVRAYLENKDKNLGEASNRLTWSGVYNAKTATNQSNVFSVGEDITKSVDPRYGSIQHIFASDSSLVIFQEDKTSRGLIDRDMLYTAEGEPIQSISNRVIGSIENYAGDFGISTFPESFASDGYVRYFADVNNNAVLRLSMDGLTEISKYGMEDYFRDEFRGISTEFQRVVVDASWTIPWSTNTSAITVSGENVSSIEIGMLIEGIVGWPDVYVDNVGTISNNTATLTLSQSINVTASPQPSVLQFVKLVRDKIIGGYDNVQETYILSIVKNEPSRVASDSTLVDIPIEEEEIPLEPS